EIDVFPGTAEIVSERRRVLIEAHEVEAAVLFEARRPLEAVSNLVETFGIGIVTRHARERAVIAVGPAMIDAHEAAGVALALGAHDRAAMPAGVEQAVKLALLVAHEDHRPAGDLAGAEVARFLELRGMPDIDPAAPEDLRHFPLQYILGDQHLAV